ncbi:hypothetical protein OEA41_005995 [Lepraria neglecta]|uniref:Uncharacterized protein n=1 Tax=Lepraria neglecta TaxID=209136 RepID=A0AAD9Z821_9LECA|nr:hypothetical protein OEA41_005995 [Lepraria neglecta]
MAARRDAGRDSSKYTSGSGSSKSKLNEFFVDGQGIHREVMQREICKYLGPEAHSRPSKYNGIQGYNVTAVRPFTAKQLDQLIELSEAYASENREKRSRGRQDVPYDQSDTLRHQEETSGLAGAPYVQDRYQPQDPYTPYTTGSAVPGYQPGYYGGYLGSNYVPDPRSDPRSDPRYAPDPRYPSDPRQDYAQSPMYPNSRDTYPPFIPKEREGESFCQVFILEYLADGIPKEIPTVTTSETKEARQ